MDSKALNKRQFENLIKCGAFDSLNSNRNQLFESIDLFNRYNANIIKDKNCSQASLFGSSDSNSYIKPNLINTDDWSSDQKLLYEGEAIGFYLTNHPLDKYQNYLNDCDIKNSKFLREELISGYSIIKIAGVATTIKTRVSPRGRFVSVTFSDMCGNFEVSIFDDKILNDCRDLISQKAPLLITAEVRKDMGGIRIMVQSIIRLESFFSSKFNNATIWIDDIEAVDVIKNSVVNNNSPNCHLKIIVINDNQEIEIKLPSGIILNNQAKMQLVENKGIVKVVMT
jgi:DNA polymerase-3 subunit alpha